MQYRALFIVKTGVTSGFIFAVAIVVIIFHVLGLSRLEIGLVIFAIGLVLTRDG